MVVVGGGVFHENDADMTPEGRPDFVALGLKMGTNKSEGLHAQWQQTSQQCHSASKIQPQCKMFHVPQARTFLQAKITCGVKLDQPGAGRNHPLPCVIFMLEAASEICNLKMQENNTNDRN